MRSSSGDRPRVSLSGLPGVTSHQTRSRPSRRIAIRQAARWASCGGSKVPPNRPIFMPGVWGGSTDIRQAIKGRAQERSRTCLPRAADAVVEAGELLDPDWAARMETAGGDADLGAEAEFAAVGKLRGRVVQPDRGIDLAQEFFRRRLVVGDD